MSGLVLEFVAPGGRTIEFRRNWEEVDRLIGDALPDPEGAEGSQRAVTQAVLDWLRRQNLQPTDQGSRALREYLTAAIAGGDSDRLPPDVPVEPLRGSDAGASRAQRDARIARAVDELLGASGGVVFLTDSVTTAAEELAAGAIGRGWRAVTWTAARAYGPDAAAAIPTMDPVRAPEPGRDVVHPEAPELLERSLRAILDAPEAPDGVVVLLCDPPFERMRDGGAGALLAELSHRSHRDGFRVAILAARDLVPPEIRADWKISRLRVMSATPLLDTYGVDLCQLQRDQPMRAFGVRPIVERIAIALDAARGVPCSPALIGVPGGGKTAVINELAWLLAWTPSDPIVSRLRTPEGEPPRLIELSVSRIEQAALQSGGIGPFVSELVSELRETHDIVFVDEVHRIANGSGIGEALKEGLGRGLRLIGATTTDEWAYIEKDRALFRRLDPIFLPEVSREEMVRQMQSVWVPKFLAEKRVRISEDVLWRGADLADAYFASMSRPARLIYLLDRATTRAKRETETDLVESDLEAVLRDRLGIGVDAEARAETLRLLRERLSAELVGQPEAVEQIVELAELYLVDADRRKLPIVVRASGPATAGIARAAEVLHEALFPGPQITKFDLSMYSQPHSVEAITGAPAGYVMSDQGSMLARRVKEANGRLVILVENWYAGASAVRALFRGFFRTGVLRPRDGSLPASFLQSIFWIADAPASTTERAGAMDGPIDAYGGADDTELASLVAFEIPFRPLGDAELSTLAERALDDVQTRCRSVGITLITDSATAAGLVESARLATLASEIGREQIELAAERLWIVVHREARRQGTGRPVIGVTWRQGWRTVERPAAQPEG